MSTYRVLDAIKNSAIGPYREARGTVDCVGGLSRDSDGTPAFLSDARMMAHTSQSTTRRSTTGAVMHMPDPAAGCVIYFDGACPLCRREIAHYRRQEGAEAIAWVDAADCDPAALGVDLPRGTALARLHARRADGSLVSGVAAFAMIWSRLDAYRWLAPFVSSRPVLCVLEVGYSSFLRMRPLWRRVATPSSSLPAAVPAELHAEDEIAHGDDALASATQRTRLASTSPSH